jgi:hypothetical protein
MDHEPFVKQIKVPESTPGVRYEAACSCGWENPARLCDDHTSAMWIALDHLPWPDTEQPC